MDARTIDNLEMTDSSAEPRNLMARWSDIVKPGVYRQSRGRLKKYHEPRFLRNERKIKDEKIQLANNGQAIQTKGSQPQEKRNEQGTVDQFWEVDRPQCQQLQQEDEPGRTVFKATTTTIHPEGRRRNRIRDGLRPVNSGKPDI